MMPCNHLILCRPLLFLLSIFPSIRVFSMEPVLCIRWPKFWSFSFNISPSNEYSGLISFRIDWLELLAVQGTLKRVFSSTTVQKHQFFSAQFLCAHSKNMYLSHPVHPAEHQRIGAFELWCWRRLLRAPWTARRANLSILKGISPEYSLEGQMRKLKLQYFGHLRRRADSLEETLMLRKTEGRRRRR